MIISPLRKQQLHIQFFLDLTKTREASKGANHHKGDHLADSPMAYHGSGMTQEMEALGFEGDEGVELTDEEADAGAREWDKHQVPAN